MVVGPRVLRRFAKNETTEGLCNPLQQKLIIKHRIGHTDVPKNGWVASSLEYARSLFVLGQQAEIFTRVAPETVYSPRGICHSGFLQALNLKERVFSKVFEYNEQIFQSFQDFKNENLSES